MTITFTIAKSKKTIEKQWEYLVKRGVSSLYPLKVSLLILVFATGLYSLLYFLTPNDYFITLKAVGAAIIVLGWMAIILYSIFIFFRNINNKSHLKRFLDTIDSDQLNYDVLINDEYVKIIYGENNTELPWAEFTRFGIYNNTIYVFNEAKALNLLYWDRNEMGNNNYLALIDLLKQKAIKKIF